MSAVLVLIYTVGWLPAQIIGQLILPTVGPTHVLAGAGGVGLRASAGLAASLVLLSVAYAVAICRPPSQRALVAACAGTLIMALAVPVLFSADTYAYAFYGDLALHGRSPYGHEPAPLRDTLARAAMAAWDGQVPPRCIYGPLAVGIAALADIAGAGAGVAGQIGAQRLAAAAAYALCIIFGLRLVRDARARAALLLNPVVIWSVAEGHNDAAMLALVLAGLATRRPRALLFALAACVKAPALVVLAWRRARGTAAACIVVVAAYLPLAVAFASAPPGRTGVRFDAAAWQSPLGLLAAAFGRGPALAVALFLLVAVPLAVRRLPAPDRIPAFALAAWFALPNAYPWYAVWIVPLATINLASVWSRSLVVASLFAAARAMIDAIFPAANTIAGAATFHGEMIALEFLPPLAFLVVGALRRRVIGTAAVLGVVAVCGLPGGAQSLAPSPLPAPSPSALASPQQNPAPQPQTAPQPQVATPLPPPPTPPAPIITATPAAPLTPSPAPTTAPPATAPPAPLTPTSATPRPTTQVPAPNPFTYVITPTAIAVTAPDGPHIVEVAVNDRRIRPGGPLIVRVVTSANVVGVEARALGRFIPIPQNSPGLFSLAYTMPGMIPFWLLNKNYDIVIAAATADGRQTSVSFPMLLVH